MFKNDTFKESPQPYDADEYPQFSSGCDEEDGDGVNGACFERFATKGLIRNRRYNIIDFRESPFLGKAFRFFLLVLVNKQRRQPSNYNFDLYC